MTRLCDVATLIRSKNAGPFELTIDVLFPNLVSLKRVVASDVLNRERVADFYHLDPTIIRIYIYEPGLAIKISFPRPIPSGGLSDFDVTGGQQYAPLVDLALPDGWDSMEGDQVA
jgi:hypothetical protein